MASFPALGQRPREDSRCASVQAPALHGFRLGMTIAQIAKRLDDPNFVSGRMTESNVVDSARLTIPATELAGDEIEGVEQIELAFVDSKVGVIKVVYFSGRWPSATTFFGQSAQSLGLPVPDDALVQGRGRNERYLFECKGFSITLAYAFGVSPNITLVDAGSQRLLDKRREREMEIRQKTITPTVRPLPRPAPPPNLSPVID